MSPRIRIVGAGLTGLAAAWRLTELGASVELIEASSGPGGLLQTVRTPAGLVERAANALVWTETVGRLFRILNLTPLIASSRSKSRFIFRDGKPRRWPLRASESLTMMRRSIAAYVTGRVKPNGEESVASWSDRVWGSAATRWLVSPALQGIYGVTADQLAASAVFGGGGGGVAGRVRRPVLVATPNGMGELSERLVEWLMARGVSFSFGTHVESLDESIPTLVCTNAPEAGRLVLPHAPRLGTTLQSMPMTSLVSTTVFFPPHPRDIHGFGVLFPRGSGVSSLGVLFNADIFAGRSALRSETWISGVSGTPSEAEIVQRLLMDREVLTQRSDAPTALVTTRWLSALPIYGNAVLEARSQLSEMPPWLALAGNYIGGIGLSKLLERGCEAASRLQRFAVRCG